MNQGKAIIFSAPSGAGKTTIVRHLLSVRDDLSFSISACSRPRRNRTEIDGVDYYFLSVEEFKKKVADDEFVEWEEVYEDSFYGTLKSEVQRIWDLGKTVIFDVDVVGGKNLKDYFGADALAIFVKPPSIQHLRDRLNLRDTETEESINIRMAKAEKEMGYATHFDYVLKNDELEVALKEAEEVVSNFLDNE
ncbi:guanylate kinase [Parvicella tangerina]|uniref:Guanylate kinase n=1 Tax=Parvicella tangerina TaxID=2829795 RepID=A0A916NGA9_9FLAO|nr:guanylate kinase [Parvicella tangerina]CAG5080252.1 Guanylate kinase [Parvicella tangerina]